MLVVVCVDGLVSVGCHTSVGSKETSAFNAGSEFVASATIGLGDAQGVVLMGHVCSLAGGRGGNKAGGGIS